MTEGNGLVADIAPPHQFLPDGGEEIIAGTLYKVYKEFFLLNHYFCSRVDDCIPGIKPDKVLRHPSLNL